VIVVKTREPIGKATFEKLEARAENAGRGRTSRP